MKNKIPILFGVILLNLCIACGGSDDEPAAPALPPTAALLVFPENNTECNEGAILSETQSNVIFRWNVSENTDSYTVNLKNLDTGNSRNVNTNDTETSITLQRGVPYSWSVISKANGINDTAESTVWKFYNAGLPTENHPPFPAEALSPRIGSSISAGTIDLSWSASDLDDDIVSYEVFIDENNPPNTSLNTTTTTTLAFAAVSGKVYYWRVVATDSKENNSSSGVFQFKVN